ncbi:MAG: PhzF family phenazine biosynthesis protein [Akkermansiaceae bacterium]
MRSLHYHLVDVFTDQPFGGNPLAVFPQSNDLMKAEMQAIAQELNLSETTFLQKAVSDEADCRVRIFTPRCEIPMAGHPTIGTAFAILEKGLLAPKSPDALVFDLGIGQTVVETKGQVTMHQPVPEFGETLDGTALAEALGLSADDLIEGAPVQVVSAGVPFILVPLKSLDAVKRASLSLEKLDQVCAAIETREVMPFCLGSETSEASAHTRMFAPRFGIIEDPATGSAQGPLGAYREKYGLTEDCTMIHEQGFEMGRPSIISIEMMEDGSAKVGGSCVLMGQGEIFLRE